MIVFQIQIANRKHNEIVTLVMVSYLCFSTARIYIL